MSINEVLLSLKRLQKVPDDMRAQRILEVLDEDQDGYIDIKNILEVKVIYVKQTYKSFKKSRARLFKTNDVVS